MEGTCVARKARGVSAVSMASDAPPTCWEVVVTIFVLERRAQYAAKMSVLTFSSLSVCWRGKGKGEGVRNKWEKGKRKERWLEKRVMGGERWRWSVSMTCAYNN